MSARHDAMDWRTEASLREWSSKPGLSRRKVVVLGVGHIWGRAVPLLRGKREGSTDGFFCLGGGEGGY